MNYFDRIQLKLINLIKLLQVNFKPLLVRIGHD